MRGCCDWRKEQLTVVVVDVGAIQAMTIGTTGGAGVVVVAEEAMGVGAKIAALETVRSCCDWRKEQLTVKSVMRVLRRSSFTIVVVVATGQ